MGPIIGKRILPSELIGSLDEVAAAVSATPSVDEVLHTVADRVKALAHTEKAVVCLVESGAEHRLDERRLVVRGRLDVHAQSWWLDELQRCGVEALDASRPVVVSARTGDALLLVAPIRLGRQPIGVLGAINAVSRGFNASEQAFLSVLGLFAAVSIESARMAEQSRYVLLSSERERIAREMHDGLSQSLFSILLGLELCKRQIARDPAGVEERLDELQTQLKDAMNEVRRYIYDLRPLKLSELGLEGAITQWVHQVTLDRHVEGEVRVSGVKAPLRPDLETCLYRVAKEAVSNVVKHAHARRFSVELAFGPGMVQLAVADDGIGLDPEATGNDADPDVAMGVHNMRDWALRMGGSFDVASRRGEGTTVRVLLPLGGAS